MNDFLPLSLTWWECAKITLIGAIFWGCVKLTCVFFFGLISQLLKE